MRKSSDTPIYNAVLKYAGQNAGRFHTPGHSGGKGLPPFFSFASYDITELSFSDNLENPTGIILGSEQKTAGIYGVERTLYFTSGATTALFCALYALSFDKKKALITENCHKSVYNALTVFGYEYQTVSLQKEEIISKLKEYGPNVFVFTSPDYYGNLLCGAKEICDFCRENGIYTLCDEAHGSHFVFSSLLPETACSFADLTVDSMHKTLPVQTGGAALNVKAKRLVPLTESARKTLNTTSPSYVTLASIDYAVSYMEKHGEKLYSKLKKKIDSTRALLEKTGVCVEKSDDFTRLVLKVKYSAALKNALEKDGIFAEGYSADKIVFIVTPFNAEYLDRIAAFFKNNPRFVKKAKTVKISKGILSQTVTDDVGSELVPLKQAEGRVAFSDVGFYPPATPLIKKGEVFTREIIDALLRSDKTYGLFKDCASVYKLPSKQ